MELGVGPDELAATNRDSSPRGLRESSLIDESVQPGAQHNYALTSLAAAGNESPRSRAVAVKVLTAD